MTTIAEIKEDKKKLEQDIAVLIQNFYKKNGVAPMEILLRWFDPSLMGLENKSFDTVFLQQVQIRLESI